MLFTVFPETPEKYYYNCRDLINCYSMEVEIDTNIDIPMPSVPSVPAAVESLKQTAKQTAIVVDNEDEEGPLGTTNVCLNLE